MGVNTSWLNSIPGGSKNRSLKIVLVRAFNQQITTISLSDRCFPFQWCWTVEYHKSTKVWSMLTVMFANHMCDGTYDRRDRVDKTDSVQVSKGRLKVLWAVTYTTAMQPYLTYSVSSNWKSIATSWTWNCVSHPSSYSITLFIQTI